MRDLFFQFLKLVMGRTGSYIVVALTALFGLGIYGRKKTQEERRRLKARQDENRLRDLAVTREIQAEIDQADEEEVYRRSSRWHVG